MIDNRKYINVIPLEELMKGDNDINYQMKEVQIPNKNYGKKFKIKYPLWKQKQ